MKKLTEEVKQIFLPPYQVHEFPVIAGTFALILTLILTVFIVRTDTNTQGHAAVANSVEPEAGTITGNVTVVTDANASGGKYVEFNNATPTPQQTTGDVQFPADSGAIFLGNAPYNVKCDGTTDNTAAIQNALNTYANNQSKPDSVTMRFSFHTLVLPAGTCMVSDTLHAPGSAIRLVGAGQGNTVLKLKDNATGYSSASTPKYVLWTGVEWSTGNANTGFGNYVQDLTIDVGSGNPGAVGLRFDGCNSAAVERITIKAPANSGLRGMTFETAPGPAQVEGVTIDGFAVGIWSDTTIVNNIQFTDITLRNQRTVGISNTGKNFAFERLTASGMPKVYDGGAASSVHFIDSTLTGPGSGTAINSAAGGFIYTRNVSGAGWGNLVSTGTTNHFVGKTAISEWASANYQRGNTKVVWSESNPIVSFNLTHPAVPHSTDYNMADWQKANVTSDNTDDDGPAIQAAIDSGKKVVYLPYGNYSVKTPVIVRGNVEAIDFMGSRISGKISVGNSTSPFVELRNASSSTTWEQNGPDAMVVSNMGAIGTSGGQVTTGSSATGDVFVDNVSGHPTSITRPVHVFIRQANREGRAASVAGGATAWIYGDNIEAHDGKSPFFTITDSTVEFIGGALDNLATGGAFNSTTGTAFYTATNSRVSITIAGVYRGTAVTGHWVSDSSGGNVTSSDVVVGAASGDFTRVVLPLYVSP